MPSARLGWRAGHVAKRQAHLRGEPGGHCGRILPLGKLYDRYLLVAVHGGGPFPCRLFLGETLDTYQRQVSGGGPPPNPQDWGQPRAGSGTR